MRRQVVLGLACLAAAGALASLPAQAGPFDKLKKKVETKVGQKTDQATDKAIDKKADEAEDEGGKAASTDGSGEGPMGSGAVSSVSTKFDFVPGDRVLFVDDFTQDELGEFPAHWKLSRGTFEVAERSGERWLRCMSQDGDVRMNVPAGLPEFWTLEFDFYGVDLASAIALTTTALSASGGTVWEMRFPYSGSGVDVRCGSIASTTPLEGSAIEGRHHVMFMARGSGLKVYFDRERVASILDVSASGVPAELNFHLGAPSHPMITNVRFAEGCRPAKDMLAEGKLVTYGIHFDTGSDVVLADSAPILRQIASYLQSKPEMKLRITGHTDNVGKQPANLDLSKRRAASVASVLTSQFGIAADRFQSDGKGDAQPLSSNAKP
jgi:hypothetical protein